jgi:hypothetical protein
LDEGAVGDVPLVEVGWGGDQDGWTAAGDEGRWVGRMSYRNAAAFVEDVVAVEDVEAGDESFHSVC